MTFPWLPLLQRAMKKDGAVPAAASTSPKGVGVDVDALLKRVDEMEARTKRLDEMEARTKRLDEALEVVRHDLKISFQVHNEILKAVAEDLGLTDTTARDLRALKRRMDEEVRPSAQLLRRLAK